MSLPLPIRILLWPFSYLYGLAARCRVALYTKGVFKRRRLKAPVISVGNLTVGGTGKTPMVLCLAEEFLAEGKRVGILTRGYRGSGGTSDEVEMLRRRLGDRVVFGVGANRHAEGSRIERENPVDIFLLDDGFQHLQLARDVDIVLWDGTKKFQRQWMLPAGSLREPISAIERADMLVISRKSAEPSRADSTTGKSADGLVFTAQTKLLGFRKVGGNEGPRPVEQLADGPFFAFCGVGNPDAFFADLRRWNVNVEGKMSFIDHHRYTADDWARLTHTAHSAGATAFVTTEKDEQNLRGRDFGEWPVYVAVIALTVAPEGEFDAEIRRLLSERRKASA
jgi:tetraacyldisaccharide 4'-kinase